MSEDDYLFDNHQISRGELLREIYYLYFFILIYSILIKNEIMGFNKTMNSFTFYHIILPFRITQFLYQMIEQLYQDELLFIKEFFTLLFFIFELIFYLIFLEIIELNFFGLNINFRKNNEKGAISDMKKGDGKNTYLAEDNDDEANKIDV